MVSGPPEAPVELPDAVLAMIGDRSHDVVWQNELGGLTIRVGDLSGGVHVKWSPTSSAIDFSAERVRLEWARTFTPVPEVVGAGSDEQGSWLITTTINAQCAVSPRWIKEPARACAALGRGLRAMHDALPVATCPYEWSVPLRLAAIEDRVARPSDEHDAEVGTPDHDRSVSLDDLGATPHEDLVVCHGDACAPNTLLDDNGEWRAHVDLGSLGVGDRWADLAVMAWSTEWNYGPGGVATVYDAYGVRADEEKIRFYRLLWTLE
jgi:kanamycin kinase